MALIRVLMIVIFILTYTNSLEFVNDCANLVETKPNILSLQNIKSEFNWCKTLY